MRVFDGIVGVFDGQLYVGSDPEDIGPDLFAHFSGQANGLLGAATPSLLCLITGVADGDIGFTVEVCEREPLLEDSWEDSVEASFSPATPVVMFLDLEWRVLCEIPLGEETYRLRYAARGMDAGHAGTAMDVYSLWFWPAPHAPDAVVRQTSKWAEYWQAEQARRNDSGCSSPPSLAWASVLSPERPNSGPSGHLAGLFDLGPP
jgi:hypothetical protein